MPALVVRDVAVLDCTGAQPGPRMDVVLRDGRIETIARAGDAGSPTPKDARTIDGSGCTLMPGLTDAHVHFALIGKGGEHGNAPWIEHVLAVAEIISTALDDGFTTVRDAGGLEPTWAKVVASGKLRGPRILPSGSFISQTGGHGDARLAHEAVHGGATIPGLVAKVEIADGPDQVRRAAREILRRGATQVKLFASGGLASPTDPFDGLQFTVEEMAAAVDVAAAYKTYVLAHCHTSPAMDRAIEAGVRSIEHGSMLEPETAKRIAAAKAFLVPTLQTVDELQSDPDRFALTPEKQAVVGTIYESMKASVGVASDAGVAIGSGSDVIGPLQGRRGREIALKASLMGAEKAIISATRTNAELFRMADRIGTVEVRKEADLILVEGEPLDDVGLLADPGCIPVVIKGGEIVKDTSRRAAS